VGAPAANAVGAFVRPVLPPGGSDRAGPDACPLCFGRPSSGGSEGDPEDVPYDPPVTAKLAESVVLVDRANAVFRPAARAVGTRGLFALMLIAAMLPSATAASAPRAQEPPLLSDAAPKPGKTTEAVARTDRVLVRWSTRLSARAAAAGPRLAAVASASGRGAAFVRFTGSGAAVYDLGAPLGDKAGGILAALDAIEGVASVEPDLWLTADVLPSDPGAADLWGLLGVADGSPYGIDAPGAWAISKGTGVVVAVIDTGLVAHEDLGGQAVAGYDMISGVAQANDLDGRDPDASDPGDWSEAGDWCGAKASSWHGTHVAGTIAALAGNGIGVFGGAPSVKVQPVRVLGRCGGYVTDIADGIRWAAGEPVIGAPANLTPARVLNLSLSGPFPFCPDELSSAISDAGSRGAVVVVSAGNEATDASFATPANCDGVITVAATDQAGLGASFSNYGSTVDLAGPGVAILSAADSGTTVAVGSTYIYHQGTSMAAPHVALTAALVAAAAPGLTSSQISTILARSATPFAPDDSATGCPAVGCGAGIVNAARAVANMDVIAPTASPPKATLANGAALDKTTVPVRLAWSGSDAGSGLARFELALRTNEDAWVPLALPSPTATTLTPLLTAGGSRYRFRVRAIDAAGNASAWAVGPILHVRKVQESSTAIRYAGTWSRGSAAAALGGRYRVTTRARASATYIFTGRSIAWVASGGAAFGNARVYIDGVNRGTVNLRASSAFWRRIVFSRTWATPGRHAIRIVGSGTAGHPRVSLDAFVVLQ
jgi:serine protease